MEKAIERSFHVVNLSCFLKSYFKVVASEYLYLNEFFSGLRWILSKSGLDNITKEIKQIKIEQALIIKLFSFSYLGTCVLEYSRGGRTLEVT